MESKSNDFYEQSNPLQPFLLNSPFVFGRWYNLKEQYDKHLPPDEQDAFTPKKEIKKWFKMIKALQKEEPFFIYRNRSQ